MKRLALWAVVGSPVLLAACGNAGNPAPGEATQVGPSPALPEQQRGLLPNMTIANPVQWGDQRPAVPRGYALI